MPCRSARSVKLAVVGVKTLVIVLVGTVSVDDVFTTSKVLLCAYYIK